MKKQSCFLIVQLIILSGFTACVSAQPWQTHQVAVKPDYSCFTGPAEAGCDVYIWRCLNNQRVVIYQCGTAFLMPQASKETSECNATTAFEKKYNINTENIGKCVQSKRIWPSAISP